MLRYGYRGAPGLTGGKPIVALLRRRMREYEIMAVYDLAVMEAGGQDASVEHLKGVVERNGGSVIKVDHWGRRRLAYPMRGQLDADYIVTRVNLDPESIAPINAALQIDEQVYRHLVVRADELPPPREPRFASRGTLSQAPGGAPAAPAAAPAEPAAAPAPAEAAPAAQAPAAAPEAAPAAETPAAEAAAPAPEAAAPAPETPAAAAPEPAPAAEAPAAPEAEAAPAAEAPAEAPPEAAAPAAEPQAEAPADASADAPAPEADAQPDDAAKE